jgi:hypothetical protein
MVAAGANRSIELSPSRSFADWRYVACGALALALLSLWLHGLGRPLVCACGTIRLWAPSQDSQQLADWYSLLHVTFGLGLFVFVRRFQPAWPLPPIMLAALLSSVAWEAIENLPVVIAQFNSPAAGRPYAGDTILNALGDTFCVVAGCLFAARASGRTILLAALMIEAAVWLAIQDGLLVGTAKLLAGA